MSEDNELDNYDAPRNNSVHDINACGNCGRRIQAHQKYLEIYNTRNKGYEHYHESYLGCYESTRESGRRIIIDRWQRGINFDTYELDGQVRISNGWKL